MERRMTIVLSYDDEEQDLEHLASTVEAVLQEPGAQVKVRILEMFEEAAEAESP